MIRPNHNNRRSEGQVFDRFVGLGPELGPIDQVAFVVRDMAAALPMYTSLFGPFSQREASYSPETTTYRGRPISARLLVAATGPNPVEIELIQVLEGEPPQADHLAQHGEGLHHVRFVVADLEPTRDSMEEAGFETVLYGSTQSGNLRAYMGAADALGHTLVEILQRGGG